MDANEVSFSPTHSVTKQSAAGDRWTVNFTLCPKGGVGKSEITKAIFDALRSTGQPVNAFDADYSSRTFALVQSIQAKLIQILDEENGINVEGLNNAVIEMIESPGHVVVDTGSYGYSTLLSYVLESGIVEIIQQSGKRVVIHSVIAGAPAVQGTAEAALDNIRQFPTGVEHVVWLSACPSYGSLRGFLDTPGGEEIKGSGAAVIAFPAATQFTEKAIQDMMRRRLTFSDFQELDGNPITKLFLNTAWIPVRSRLLEVLA